MYKTIDYYLDPLWLSIHVHGTVMFNVCVFVLGQCEFSFSKTAVVMEMNKKEMDRYDSIYR